MSGLIFDFLLEWIAVGTEFMGTLVLDFVDNIFWFDQLISEQMSADSFDNIFNYIYGASVLLITLKFLYKGFMVYIVGRDGDDAVSPKEYLKGAAAAVIISAAFPFLYKYLADFSSEMLNKILDILAGEGGMIDMSSTGALMGDALATLTGIPALLVIIYIVNFIILYFKMLKQGAELMILRLGVPFAAVGLINNDSGVWKPYAQQFIKVALTVIVQFGCIFLSVKLFMTMNYILAIVMIMLAKSIPMLLNQFLIMGSSNGGNIGAKIGTATTVINTVRNVLK